MVADFMGDHVGLREIPWCLEALSQIAVEGKIDIHFVIFAAVKRTGRRLSKAAGRLDGAREKHQGWFLISSPGALKDLIPCPLRAAQYARDELAHLVICAGLLRLILRDTNLWHIALQQETRIETEKERKQDDDEGTNAASGNPSRYPTAATVFDVSAFRFSIEIDGDLLFAAKILGNSSIG